MKKNPLLVLLITALLTGCTAQNTNISNSEDILFAYSNDSGVYMTQLRSSEPFQSQIRLSGRSVKDAAIPVAMQRSDSEAYFCVGSFNSDPMELYKVPYNGAKPEKMGELQSDICQFAEANGFIYAFRSEYDGSENNHYIEKYSTSDLKTRLDSFRIDGPPKKVIYSASSGVIYMLIVGGEETSVLASFDTGSGEYASVVLDHDSFAQDMELADGMIYVTLGGYSSGDDVVSDNRVLCCGRDLSIIRTFTVDEYPTFIEKTGDLFSVVFTSEQLSCVKRYDTDFNEVSALDLSIGTPLGTETAGSRLLIAGEHSADIINGDVISNIDFGGSTALSITEISD